METGACLGTALKVEVNIVGSEVQGFPLLHSSLRAAWVHETLSQRLKQ